MKAYRAYVLDEHEIVIRAKAFEARSDDAAAQAAAAWAPGTHHELWTGITPDRDPRARASLRPGEAGP
jgi:hypothetical protein